MSCGNLGRGVYRNAVCRLCSNVTLIDRRSLLALPRRATPISSFPPRRSFACAEGATQQNGRSSKSGSDIASITTLLRRGPPKSSARHVLDTDVTCHSCYIIGSAWLVI